MTKKQATANFSGVHRRGVLCAAVVGFLPCFTAYASEAGPVSMQSDMALKESELASKRMELCSAANPTGLGLQGDYYEADDCTGPIILSRVEGPVQLDPAAVWPQKAPRSARWRGWIKPPLPGKYAFHADHPRAMIVVAHQVFNGGDGSALNQIEMAAGRYYPLVLEVHGLNVTVDEVRLEWTAPHGMRYLLPRALMYLPT